MSSGGLIQFLTLTNVWMISFGAGLLAMIILTCHHKLLPLYAAGMILAMGGA